MGRLRHSASNSEEDHTYYLFHFVLHLTFYLARILEDKMRPQSILLVVLPSQILGFSHRLEAGRDCDFVEESCVLKESCQDWCEQLGRGGIRSQETRQMLNNNLCGFRGRDAKICCRKEKVTQQLSCDAPTPETQTLLTPPRTPQRPSQHECGVPGDIQDTRVANGIPVPSPGAWPWMARLLYSANEKSPEKTSEKAFDYPSSPMVLKGWGNEVEGIGAPNSSRVLQMLPKLRETPLEDTEDLSGCKTLLGLPLLDSQMCIEGPEDSELNSNACQGDSGGPVSQLLRESKGEAGHWQLVGVISFGKGPCGSKTPLVVTRVGEPATLAWITETIGEKGL